MKENGLKEPRRGRQIGRTIGVFTLGAAAGSIIALLYAPASGRVTRRRIALKVRAVRQQTVRQLGRTKKLLVRQAEQLREATGDKFNDAREWVTERMHNNGHARRPIRHRVAHHA